MCTPCCGLGGPFRDTGHCQSLEPKTYKDYKFVRNRHLTERRANRNVRYRVREGAEMACKHETCSALLEIRELSLKSHWGVLSHPSDWQGLRTHSTSAVVVGVRGNPESWLRRVPCSIREKATARKECVSHELEVAHEVHALKKLLHLCARSHLQKYS